MVLLRRRDDPPSLNQVTRSHLHTASDFHEIRRADIKAPLIGGDVHCKAD
ncbi:MAG: hypothetical protein O2856_00200 [Planctomycetota bacterium]|nr:hypothetical protein [Planctomycetota bacterium]